MISVVGLESVMMHDGVCLKGLFPSRERPVHEILVQRPFKKRGENHPATETDRRPKNKRFKSDHI
jgi:ribulose bisphosphate carboxylase small subunit